MKKILAVLCVCVMLAGCGRENMESSSVVEITETVTEQAETENKYYSAYREILNGFMNSGYYSKDSAFSLYDMNDDRIPELFISEDICHAAGCRIYTCDQNVKFLGEYGSDGGVCFYPDTRYLVSSYIGQGETHVEYYSMENNSLNEHIICYDNSGRTEEKVYKINDTEVTQEEYNSAKQEPVGEYKKELGRDFPLTEPFIDFALTSYSDWKNAYTNLLYNLSETDFITQGGGFSVYDITGDDIPELFISRDSIRNAQCYIYTFDNTVKALGEYGAYGSVGYSPEYNLMYTYDLHQGYEYIKYYRLGKYDLFNKEISFFNNRGGAETEADVQYTINGEDISSEEYQNTLEKYKDENGVWLGLDYKVSKNDIEKALEKYTDDQ